ncbi:hypothetical protein ANN_13760 [Periplaneta americana]|uniref:Uncharacterized protein n=1 Tax=Periplaneta americana TaxID=6978 RepID=A0ABQ8SVX8_PERAM|nr:hypothetical protein ANN_13760 [Periplaneta americana]
MCPNVDRNKELEESAKEAEIRLAAFAAEHDIAFLTMDHLSQLVKTICPDSEIAKKMTCGRTKSRAIVTNVIGREMKRVNCPKPGLNLTNDTKKAPLMTQLRQEIMRARKVIRSATTHEKPRLNNRLLTSPPHASAEVNDHPTSMSLA